MKLLVRPDVNKDGPKLDDNSDECLVLVRLSDGEVRFVPLIEDRLEPPKFNLDVKAEDWVDVKLEPNCEFSNDEDLVAEWDNRLLPLDVSVELGIFVFIQDGELVKLVILSKLGFSPLCFVSENKACLLVTLELYLEVTCSAGLDIMFVFIRGLFSCNRVWNRSLDNECNVNRSTMLMPER